MKAHPFLLNKAEIDHLLTLLRDNCREGSYYGNRTRYRNRADRLFRKLERGFSVLTDRDGWPLPSIENRRSESPSCLSR